MVIAGDTFDDWGAASAGGRDFMAAKYVGIRMGEKGESTVDHFFAEDLGQRAVETNQCPFNAKYFPCAVPLTPLPLRISPFHRPGWTLTGPWCGSGRYREIVLFLGRCPQRFEQV